MKIDIVVIFISVLLMVLGLLTSDVFMGLCGVWVLLLLPIIMFKEDKK